MEAGLWWQHEVWDGTYTLTDLLDAHEMLLVRAENKTRAHEYEEMQRQMMPRMNLPRHR